MQRLLKSSTIFSLAFLSGCASIMSGTSQNIMVNTDPSGADCRVTKGGVLVGEVASTPGYVNVQRGSKGLEISCTKPGYAKSQTVNATGMETWILGNILIGGLIGIVVDFSTGAAYRYDSDATLAMQGAPIGSAPVIGAAGFSGTGYGYQQLTRAYPTRAGAAEPLIVPAASPKGDVTYRWGASD